MKKFSTLNSIVSAILILGAVSVQPVLAQQATSGVSAAMAASNVISIAAVSAKQVGSVTELRLGTSATLGSVPNFFTMSSPSRIVFDVPGSVNATSQRLHQLNQGNVSTVNFVQAQGVTRVVVQLTEAVVPDMTVEGRELVLRFGQAAAKRTNGEVVAKRFAENAGSSHTLSAIDFRKGPSGEGRIIVDLSDNSTGIEIKQSGNSLQVDFQNSGIAEQFLRRMNVTDFGTPVKQMTVTRNGTGVRMLIEPQGLWEYNAFQTDTRFVLEVRPVVYDANKLTQGTTGAYKGEKMSLNFQSVDIRNLINVIADFTKLNIVTSDAVQGQMTIRLQDVPWDQALDIILKSRGLDMRKNGKVIWIAPAEEISKREKDRLETANTANTLEPLRTESFQLNYTRTEDVIKLLSNDKQKVLSARGSVVSDPRTNQLFVMDTPTSLGEVAKIIAKLDIPVRQVVIEARIVEAGDKFSKTLGARLGFVQAVPSRIFGGPTQGIIGTTSLANGALTGQALSTPDFLKGQTQVNLPASGLDTGAQTGSFAISLLNGAGTHFLNLELNALEADGRGKIVSSPSVVTSDKETAIIEQGTEIPYLEASASGAATVAFKKANLRLEVQPQITPDGNVIMSVDINKDAPGATTTGGLAIDTKHVKTNVLVENGGTVVIGGIFTQEERNDVSRIPVLGDLPVLGHLFRNTTKKDSKTELMIFLTPRILETRLGGSNSK